MAAGFANGTLNRPVTILDSVHYSPVSTDGSGFSDGLHFVTVMGIFYSSSDQ